MGATLGAFVFVPGIRRVIEWQTSFSAFNILAILPLLMLLPILALVIRRRAALKNNRLTPVLAAWIAAFTYAAVVGVVQKSFGGGAYGLVQFVLPAVVGAWLATRPETPALAYERIASSLLLFAGIAGAYGVYQYVVAPPWDVRWLLELGSSDTSSFGNPVPFGIRTFSVLNSPGTFGSFEAAVLVFNLPRIDLRNVPRSLLVLATILGLLLSLVRSGWIAVVLGAVLYALLSPRRLRAVGGLAAMTAVCTAVIAAAFVLTPSEEARETLTLRALTFTQLQDDGSAAERRVTTADALVDAVQQPLGTGLGTTGVSQKLLTDDQLALRAVPISAIDEGFVSRLLEMGVPGFALMLLTFGLAAAATLRAAAAAKRKGDLPEAIVASVSLAFQVVTVASLFAGDNVQGILAVIYFAAVALPLVRAAPATVPAEPPLAPRRFRTIAER